MTTGVAKAPFELALWALRNRFASGENVQHKNRGEYASIHNQELPSGLRSEVLSGYPIPWFFVPQAGSISGMARPSPSSAGDPALVAIGAAIRTARRQNGLSQEALAHDAGLDRSYVGGIERGEHNLTVLNLMRIAKALDMRSSAVLESAGI